MKNLYRIIRGIDIISGDDRLLLGPGDYSTSSPWEISVLANYPGATLISSDSPTPAPTEDQKITALSKRLSAVESVLAKVKGDIGGEVDA